MIVGVEKLKYLVENEVQGCMFKNKCDLRIINIGYFFCKSSLDELF